MVTRVVVLGAGFGGLELATTVAARCPDAVELTLVDQAEGFVFGFSKLDVMFGRTQPERVLHRYAGLGTPGVRFVAATVTAIDPATRRVETTAGAFDADILVVALGADLHPEATPGLLEGGHEFYTVAGAFAVRDVLERFPGGRVVVAVTSTPFKCPPAPSETALLTHEFLSARGLRERSEISLVMPLGTPIPPSPEASAAVLAAFEERGIRWYPERLVRSLDAERSVALLSDGSELEYDLFLGVPVHRAPAVVAASGLAVDGWIPVDPDTLETAFPGVYAIGDVTSVGTPKAGVFAEGQAAVAAQRIVATVRGESPEATYDGRGICYLEFGGDRVAKVDVTFRAGERPFGGLQGPSLDLAADKHAFGTDRIRRWFGREWDF
ncbi:FAD-dependent oxidoreductase [Dactylosporangium sp. AC04546]|uniref:NAD(P)/FAD-dependent oxidoreductase n=1 Tax=Dactylosporangium sp. AC04546 TaxID=2862460 RepID=UPI001EDD88F5|nr:FAD-dependent oxidoreductase [Dactylosporangium sp. AC04546]WVK78982.1 FAD-dependent oxidoreductase [Dactylosporangium sp. AC04546]